MADEKKADAKPDEKKKSRGAVLYDAPKGEPKHGARQEKPAQKGADGKSDAKPDKDATAEKAPKDDKGNAKAEDPKDHRGETAGTEKAGGEQTEAKPKDDRAEMHKRHEAERRDFHNNTREAHRQMTSRHEKEIKALNEKGAGTAQPAEKVPGNEPEKPQAQAVAAAAPAM